MPLIEPLTTTTIGPRSEADVLTTTTIFTVPTSDVGTNARSSVPVPAIAGGVVGGALLAVIVTFIWVWWGRSIKRKNQKERQEMEKHRKTIDNTIRNAQISGPKKPSYRPLLKQVLDDKRVKFAGDGKEPVQPPQPKQGFDPEKAKHMLFDNPSTPPPRPLWTLEHRLRRSGSAIWPLPLNPLKKLSQNSMRSNHTEASTSQTGQDGAEKSIVHKPSNVSANSNASGESRQGRAPASLILAALGNLGNRNSSHASDRQSSSSRWSYLFRSTPGARASQASAESAYQPPTGDQTYPVGTAL